MIFSVRNNLHVGVLWFFIIGTEINSFTVYGICRWNVNSHFYYVTGHVKVTYSCLFVTDVGIFTRQKSCDPSAVHNIRSLRQRKRGGNVRESGMSWEKWHDIA